MLFASARLRLGVAALTMFSFALVPAVAAAQSNPTDAQYGDSLTQLSQGAAGGGPGGSAGSADTGAVGDLPFTGLDVALLAAVAAALVLVGLLLRSRRPADPPQA